jgi:5-methylcytosine-specific restriction endonuclease McrA
MATHKAKKKTKLTWRRFLKEGRLNEIKKKVPRAKPRKVSGSLKVFKSKKVYQKYLESDHWKKVKIDYYRERERICSACGAKRRIQLHHLTYKKVGRERPQDLVPLCQSCHKLVHQILIDKGGGLKQVTLEYINNKKNEKKN